MDGFKNFLKNNKWAVILTIGGVLYALLCMEIGFWRTILLTIVAAVCFYIGMSIDKKNKDKFEE